MSEAIRIVSAGQHNPMRAHERIKDFYDWSEITERTERVYEAVFESEPYDFWTRLHRCVWLISINVQYPYSPCHKNT